jgi:predicted nicotinamide N-methyase
MRDEHIVVAGRELVITRPDDPESLIDEGRFDEDEFLPYWAELWPSGIALARHVGRLDLDRKRVLELGCGLALPSFAAALAGAEVVATDWAADAVELVVLNAAANGLSVTAAVLRWDSDPAPAGATFDLVLAADVLYEQRNALPLLDLLEETLAPGGEALIADPGRRHAAAFFDSVCAAGWSVEQIAVDILPGGGIARLHRR